MVIEGWIGASVITRRILDDARRSVVLRSHCIEGRKRCPARAQRKRDRSLWKAAVRVLFAAVMHQCTTSRTGSSRRRVGAAGGSKRDSIAVRADRARVRISSLSSPPIPQQHFVSSQTTQTNQSRHPLSSTPILGRTCVSIGLRALYGASCASLSLYATYPSCLPRPAPNKSSSPLLSHINYTRFLSGFAR